MGDQLLKLYLHASRRETALLEPPRVVPASSTRRRRLARWLWLLPVAAAVGAILWWHPWGQPHRPPRPEVAQTVGAAAATRGDLPIVLDGLGTATPLATVTVQSQISGTLTEVGYREGQMVAKGDFLAEIDPRPYQVALEQTQGTLARDQALLKQAQADLARYRTLARQDSIAGQQVDDQISLVGQYTGAIQSDQAAIDAQKLNLVYCRITAPIYGRAGLRLVDAGNYVQAGGTPGLRGYHQAAADHCHLQPARGPAGAGAAAAACRGDAAGHRLGPQQQPSRSPPARWRPSTTRSTSARARSSCGRVSPMPTTPSSPTSSSTPTC